MKSLLIVLIATGLMSGVVIADKNDGLTKSKPDIEKAVKIKDKKNQGLSSTSASTTCPKGQCFDHGYQNSCVKPGGFCYCSKKDGSGDLLCN